MRSGHGGRALGRMVGDGARSNYNFLWLVAWAWGGGGLRGGALVWLRTGMPANVKHVASLLELIFSRVLSQIQARSRQDFCTWHLLHILS